MRRVLTAGVMGLVLMAAGVGVSAKAAIQGDYVEVRSADIYAGACYANSEVGLVGKEAMLAWKVKSGSWQGVDVSGLGVVAVVKANGYGHGAAAVARAALAAGADRLGVICVDEGDVISRGTPNSVVSRSAEAAILLVKYSDS
jgi:hypothetical protein